VTNSPQHRSLVQIHAQVDVDIREVVKLLNGSMTDLEEHQFWMRGDTFHEVDDRVPEGYDSESLSRMWIQQRAIACDTLRRSISEWIDSGRRKNGRESSRHRDLKRAPLAQALATQFWQTSRIIHKAGNLQLLPPLGADFGFDRAEWKVQRIIAVIVASDWRLLLAKCRYKKCKRPYFLLDKKRTERTYKDGIFCRIPSHRRIAAAKRHIGDYRKKVQQQLTQWAAERLDGMHAPEYWWHENRRIKESLAAHLALKFDSEQGKHGIRKKTKRSKEDEKSIKVNWVTRHWREIEKKRRSYARS
jgi:hypothetical protein